VRTVPANPATDPYFPIGQAELTLRERSGEIVVALKTLTPNFQRYEIQIEGSGWKPAGDEFEWTIHPGTNHLEARTLNKFGVTGPLSIAEIKVSE
jgi:hypothetical protein